MTDRIKNDPSKYVTVGMVQHMRRKEFLERMTTPHQPQPHTDGWQDIATAPHEGKFLVAEYAPTNWAYYVKTVRIIDGIPERHREIQLRYATHWRPMLPEPPSTTQSKDGETGQ